MVFDGAFSRPERLGDFAIAVTPAHEAQRLDLTPAEPLRPVDRLEFLSNVPGRPQDALGNRRPHQRASGGDIANGARQIVERHVFEQEAPRAGPDPLEQRCIVIERCQEDRRRKTICLAQRLEHVDA